MPDVAFQFSDTTIDHDLESDLESAPPVESLEADCWRYANVRTFEAYRREANSSLLFELSASLPPESHRMPGTSSLINAPSHSSSSQACASASHAEKLNSRHPGAL